MTTLGYFKSLAMELRKRRLSEDHVADVLRELQSHVLETGEEPAEAFGSAREYAARFPRGTTVSRGSRIGNLAAAVLIVLVGVKVVLGLVLGISFGIAATVIYLAATLLVTAVLIGWSAALQRELPESMTQELSR
ncbi:HAAS signaling domain-containing protein [Pseudarthrobacter sp. CCNWLW207]|uniref:HAAS signaling domain-containing protein n=1 Tax=Pseudarthrobacter sp. CCNWLW207 TaxID=3127468 RepID=UPI0030777D26